MATYSLLRVTILSIFLQSPSRASNDIDCERNKTDCSLNNVTCPDTGDCNVYCYGTNCQGSTITCPINGDCYIECIDGEGCMGMTINATKQNGNFELYCSDIDDINDRICQNIKVYGSTLDTNKQNGTSFVITCGRNWYACQNMYVNCAQGMNCQIDCHDKNKPDGQDGGRDSCTNSIINGPKGYDLRVECNDNDACENAIIRAQDSSLLNITCMDSKSCVDITVYCPPNTNGDKHCILSGKSGHFNKGQINNGIQLYTMYGWDDIIINTMGQTWTINNGGNMYCGNYYQFNCILDNWNCSNPNDTCINVPTLSPTNSPSISPSVSPSYEPSIQPTNNPSVHPTIDPTTTNPTTSAPTTIPKATPSVMIFH